MTHSKSNIKSVALLAAFCLLGSLHVLAENILRLPSVAGALKQGDTPGCAPVSLLNMLKLGPENFKKAYAELSGGEDEKALNRLCAKYTSPSGAKGRARYNNNSGMNDKNTSMLCEQLFKDKQLGAIHTLYTVRKAKEDNAAYANRINAAIVASLKRGIPVIMSIDSYGISDGKWKKLTGHYMLITGVQPVGKTNPDNFLIEFIDPVGAVHAQAFIYASDRRESRAIAHFPERDKWLSNNPYLYMATPHKNLRESQQQWGAAFHRAGSVG